MNLEILNNREIKPQKVATKQGEAQTTVLKFTRDSYKYDQIDLRNYKAYAVTSFNGEIDMTQLTMTTSGSQLILTWALSERVLRYAGSIIYQIVFKGTADSAAVFSTYQGIIQNSESIDGDNYMSSNYPTVMKQWLDLINARSGVIPHKVVYMYPGQSVPLEERTAGTLYYQWDEAHSTLAVAATGQVNLGSSPYADSGLYINGKHVYVDDTSDTVYVLEPSVWVDTINAADCGVIATDVSDDDVKILLTASTAGRAGNAITYELGLAQYGAGKGQTNPSGGTTVGSTLTDGYDAQTGVEKPIGQFEDHFGNVLARTGAKLVPSANFDELLEDGEYICSGSFETPIQCTYCMLRVTDSPSTNRVIQECYVVDLSDNTVRTFIRSISGGSTFGAWRELVTNHSAVMFPDYANGVDIYSTIASGITMTCNAWVYVRGSRGNGGDGNSGIYLNVNGKQVMSARGYDYGQAYLFVPVRKGDKISISTNAMNIAEAKYFPMC